MNFNKFISLSLAFILFLPSCVSAQIADQISVKYEINNIEKTMLVKGRDVSAYSFKADIQLANPESFVKLIDSNTKKEYRGEYLKDGLILRIYLSDKSSYDDYGLILDRGNAVMRDFSECSGGDYVSDEDFAIYSREDKGGKVSISTSDSNKYIHLYKPYRGETSDGNVLIQSNTAYDLTSGSVLAFSIKKGEYTDGYVGMSLRNGSRVFNIASLNAVGITLGSSNPVFISDTSNNWHHILVKIDNEKLNIYLDGEIKHTQECDLSLYPFDGGYFRVQNNSGNTSDGANSSYFDNFFVGGDFSLSNGVFISRPTASKKYSNTPTLFVESGKYSIKSFCINYTDAVKSMYLISAHYSEDGLLKSLDKARFSLDKKFAGIISTEVDFNEFLKTDYIKIFLMDIDHNLTPYAYADVMRTDNNTPHTAFELINLYNKYGRERYPKLSINQDYINKAKEQIKTDSAALSYHNKIISEADKIVENLTFDIKNENSDYYIGYKMITGDRLLTISERVLDFAKTLSYAYIMTENDSYINSLWSIYETAGYYGFNDWHPSHFLDTAVMAKAFAIGLDWLHDYWSDKQISYIKESIGKYALNECIDSNGNVKNHFWRNNDTNWNAICAGGILQSAIMLLDDESYADIALKLTIAMSGDIKNSLVRFAPDGAWAEGTGYWQGTAGSIAEIIESLKNTFGTDFGYSLMSGLNNTALFAIYSLGPNGSNNFHDAQTAFRGSYAMMYFGQIYENPVIAKARLDIIEKYNLIPDVLDMLYYNSDFDLCDVSSLENSGYFADTELVSMRSDWTDTAAFLSTHAGKNNEGHAHFDSGTFVFDIDGVRWVHDLGGEDYTVTDYFGTLRDTYYRVRTEGHNCVVINPSSKGGGQEKDNETAIIKKSFTGNTPYAIADLTDAYREDVTSYRRGYVLLENNGFGIKDEITLKKDNSIIYWFLHTKADVVIDGTAAVFNQDGKTMVLNFDISGADILSYAVCDAKTLSETDPGFDVENYPSNAESDTNNGYKKIMLKLGAVDENITINAGFTKNDNQNFDISKPLSQW